MSLKESQTPYSYQGFSDFFGLSRKPLDGCPVQGYPKPYVEHRDVQVPAAPPRRGPTLVFARCQIPCAGWKQLGFSQTHWGPLTYFPKWLGLDKQTRPPHARTPNPDPETPLANLRTELDVVQLRTVPEGFHYLQDSEGCFLLDTPQ